MGRPKRKSEGDLPTAKRPLRRVDDDDHHHEEPESSQADNEDSDDQPFVNNDRHSKVVKHVKKSAPKPAPKSRKSEPVRRIQRSDDDDVEEEDIGLLGSQQLQDLATRKERDKALAAKATAEFKTMFNSTVEDDEKALIQQVETLSKESTKRDLDFLDTFRSAFMASKPRDPASVEDSSRGKGHPTAASSPMIFASLHDRSQLLISNATSIIAEFEKAKSMTSNIEVSDLIDVKEMEEATTRVQEVVDLGRRVGIERYEKMLAGEEDHRRRSRNVNVNVHELEQKHDLLDEETAEHYYPSKQFEGFVGWGDVARKAEKYTRRLLKALPAKVIVPVEGEA